MSSLSVSYHLARSRHRLGLTPSPRRGGFSLIELLAVLGIMTVMVVIAVPLAAGAVRSYHLTAAATAITGSIQKTRYLAIENGCPYTIAFKADSTTYQVQTQVRAGVPPACAAGFTNVGTTIPWSTSNDVRLLTATTLQFSPNGLVTATTGALAFQLSNGSQTRTITVSGVGNATVKMP